jgi:hypothetical protein
MAAAGFAAQPLASGKMATILPRSMRLVGAPLDLP